MNATEIVIREVQGDGGFQMRQLLAESIGQPRKAPKLHSHGQVLPFDKAGGDMIGIGIASADFGYNLRDARRGVPRIGAVVMAEVPEQFHKLREVRILSKALTPNRVKTTKKTSSNARILAPFSRVSLHLGS